MPVCTLFLFDFFFLMEISLRTPVPLFKPGLVDDGLDSWVNYGWAFPDKCFLWAGFPDSFHCVPGQQSQPTQTFVGWRAYGCLWCNEPAALLAVWLGTVMCCCGNTGVEQTLNRNLHGKFNLKKKILPPLLFRFELRTFWSGVWHFMNWTIQTTCNWAVYNCEITK